MRDGSSRYVSSIVFKQRAASPCHQRRCWRRGIAIGCLRWRGRCVLHRAYSHPHAYSNQRSHGDQHAYADEYINSHKFTNSDQHANGNQHTNRNKYTKRNAYAD